MDPASPADQPRQPLVLLLAFALAWAGGCVAYTPFLTLLLPLRLTVLAGVADIHWLGIAATTGAIAASFGNVAAGWLSDRLRIRLPLSLAGLVAIAFGTLALARATTPQAMLVALAGWQLALNLFLAPLAAYAADQVPNAQKGLLGGMLAFGPGIAALSVVAVAFAPPDLPDQLALILALVVASAAPLFLMRKPRTSSIPAVPLSASSTHSRRTLVQLWFARLSVQLAEGLLFLFLYYALRQLSGGELSVARYAGTNAIAQLCSIPLALAVGRHSDRTGRRRAPLLAMLAVLATGLATMAAAGSWTPAVLGYGLFLIGSNSFLALHSTFSMQQLRDPAHYGRDLGLFNLTNTLPSLVTPLLAVLVIGAVGYSGLLAGLAVAMIVPALLITRVRIA